MGKRMIRRCVVSVITFLLLITTSQVAYADIIAGPREREDEFYAKHSNECTSVNRFYITNGSKGYVTVWLSPTTLVSIKKLQNETEIHVNYIYQDKKNILWGGVPDSHGWIRLSDATNKNLPVIDYAQPTIHIPPSKKASSGSLLEGTPTSVLFIGISLLLLIIVTVLLIRYFWKKENKNG